MVTHDRRSCKSWESNGTAIEGRITDVTTRKVVRALNWTMLQSGSKLWGAMRAINAKLWGGQLKKNSHQPSSYKVATFHVLLCIPVKTLTVFPHPSRRNWPNHFGLGLDSFLISNPLLEVEQSLWEPQNLQLVEVQMLFGSHKIRVLCANYTWDMFRV